MSALSLHHAAALAPEAPALVQGPHRWSFGELSVRCAEPLHAWRRLGAEEPGRVLGFSARAELSSVLRLYAALTHALPVVLFHPRLTAAERAALAARVPGLVDLDTGRVHPGRFPSELVNPARGEERAAALFFTSGTAGAPKLAVLSRRALLRAAEMSATHLGWRSDDRWLLSIPPAHVGGLSILTRCLLAGRPVVLPASPGPFDASLTLAEIDARRVSLISVVPTMLESLLEAGPSPPPSLRAVLVGGAPLAARLRARAVEAGWPIRVTYGLTEAGSQVATTGPLRALVEPDEGEGRPLPGIEVEIRAGGIWIRGPNLLSGYLEGETLAAPFDAEGWFDTGDLGHLDAAGRLHVEARRTDLILSGGENVYPAELERALEAAPHVLEALVVGVPDPRWGEVPAALLRVAPGFEEAALRRALEPQLAAYKRPKHWILVDGLPRNAMGKLDRGAARLEAARRLSLDASPATAGRAPG